jgi:DNA-binding HxlR family transcriptional regulator
VTEYAQFCALARAAEILGERWTLLILRELYLGPKRFSDLSARLKPVAPGILNGRLRSLERHGVIARRNVGPPTPARLYELTESGRALEPALFELLRWGARYLFPQRPGERFETEWLVMVLRAYLRGGATPNHLIALRIEGFASPVAWIHGGEAGTEVALFGEGEDATVETSVGGVLGLMSSRLPFEDAVASDTARVTGSMEAARAFPSYFLAAGEAPTGGTLESASP